MPEKVGRETTIGKIVREYPDAVEILLNNGLHCIGCGVSFWETIEQGATAHGMNEKQISKMIEKINERISKRSVKK